MFKMSRLPYSSNSSSYLEGLPSAALQRKSPIPRVPQSLSLLRTVLRLLRHHRTCLAQVTAYYYIIPTLCTVHDVEQHSFGIDR